jgi:hypothetical protein
MKSRIRGGDAARAAVATTERLPVTLQASDLIGPFQPVPDDVERKKPPRVRKPSASHDVIHAPTATLKPTAPCCAPRSARFPRNLPTP